MYKRRKQRLLSRAEFLKRVGRHGLVALGVLVSGLGIGVLGYHCLAHLSWIDSLLNASMILGGMGPIDPLPTNAGKVSLRFTLCFGSGVHRHRISAARAVCSSNVTSLSRGGARIMDFLKRFASSSDFFGMKKFLLHWFIAGAALAGMASCAQVKKPAAQVKAAAVGSRFDQVGWVTLYAGEPCTSQSCSIFAVQDRRSGWRRRGMKRKSSPTRRRKSEAYIFRENGDVADNQSVATLK